MADASARAQERSALKARIDLALIKPTHYNDSGYATQWRKSAMPRADLVSPATAT
jgi:hypothetical protein